MGEALQTQLVIPPTGVEAPVKAAPTPERPPWLPEKFATVEDLAKSYTELEKKQSQPKVPETKKPEEKAGEPEVPPKGLQIPPPTTDEVKAEEAVQKAGLDMKALESEMIANGDLTEETYKKLEDAGITKDAVGIYKRGLEAKKSDFESHIAKDIKGGLSELHKALEWAAEGLSPEEQDAFNRTLANGDKEAGKLAAEGLMSRFIRADGPRLIDGTTAVDRRDIFESSAQITEAMKDPRYQTDPAYRSKVEAKILRS